MQAVTRQQLLAARWHVQQAGRDGKASDCDILDYGVQDSGPDGAPWALRIRGAVVPDENLAVAWTIRGAPHYYRRSDLTEIAVAVCPLSSADAGKRIFDANKQFKESGVDSLVAMSELSTAMRTIVDRPTPKGEMSRQLTDVLPDHFLRFCKPCNAIHPYEISFRIAALQAGLELRAGTSPPIVQRIKGLQPNNFRRLGTDATARFDVIRNHLRFYGAATPKQVASFLDAPVQDVKAHWPSDVTPVTVEGETRSALTEYVDVLTDPPKPTGVFLLGPYDPLLQTRDRDLLIPDARIRKTIWPALGRPGVIFSNAEPIGTWRPAKAGKKLNINIELWTRQTAAVSGAIKEQAQQLAEFRGATLSEVRSE
ncbi:DNA glycosylase AlkZ-like family protein [Nocardia sp. 348MFTsu5.1]|uniref:DNA glycosylase AlkZ-like family protein n=1 Tax=Nocardia sp. 348MFTsu5.1 TaxID=1172185 RepID=UPI0003772940|nr:crosslink repair DNA glycosylase YcaQ family protein [Nocardia sp. 348MFTsu5.1]